MNQAPPRPPSPTGRARSPHYAGSNQSRIGLPQLRARRTESRHSRDFRDRRGTASGFRWHRTRPSTESNKRMPPIPSSRRSTLDLPAAPVRARRRDPRRAAGAHPAQRLAAKCALTWVIGKGEHKLLEGLDGRGIRRLRQEHRPGRHARVAQATRQATLRRAAADAGRRARQPAVGLHPGASPHRLRPLALEGPARAVRQRTHPRSPRHPRARCHRQLLRTAGPAAGPKSSGTCRYRTRRANGRARNGPTMARRR